MGNGNFYIMLLLENGNRPPHGDECKKNYNHKLINEY
jgi:hypothetical protein